MFHVITCSEKTEKRKKSTVSCASPRSDGAPCHTVLDYSLYADLKLSELVAFFNADPIAILTANSIDISHPDVENRYATPSATRAPPSSTPAASASSPNRRPRCLPPSPSDGLRSELIATEFTASELHRSSQPPDSRRASSDRSSQQSDRRASSDRSSQPPDCFTSKSARVWST